MSKTHKEAAGRLKLVSQMQQGVNWQIAAQTANLKISCANAQRLFELYQQEPGAVLVDGRKGHRSKFTPAICEWLGQKCQQAPELSSTKLQAEIKAKFGLSVSKSQINRVRAELGQSKPTATLKKSAAQTSGRVE